jgi:hypothetical protein
MPNRTTPGDEDESTDRERWHLEQRTMSKEVDEAFDGAVESDEERGVNPLVESLGG